MVMLLSDIARENAACNQRLAHSMEMEGQRLEQLRAGLEQLQELKGKEALRRRITRNAGESLRYTLRQSTEAQSIWDGTLADVEDGMEGGDARQSLHAVLEVFNSWFGLAKATRDLWQVAVANGAIPEGLESLEAAVSQVEGLKKAAEELSDF